MFIRYSLNSFRKKGSLLLIFLFFFGIFGLCEIFISENSFEIDAANDKNYAEEFVFEEAFPVLPEKIKFKLISQNEGFLLMDNELLWTKDFGSTWTDISPSKNSNIGDVCFFDKNNGWAILIRRDQFRFPSLELAKTFNSGLSWNKIDLNLFREDEIDSFISNIFLFVLNERIGYIVTRRATSSNFSIGCLFRTLDGGLTWERLPIPIAEPVNFISKDVGWVVGGPCNNLFYMTRDGGKTWEEIKIPLSENIKNYRFKNPKFESIEIGIIPVMASYGDFAYLEFYKTENCGKSWEIIGKIPIKDEFQPLTPFIYNSRKWILIDPVDKKIFKYERVVSQGEIKYLPSIEGFASIIEIDFIDEYKGWALFQEGIVSWLSATRDGGLSWQVIKQKKKDFFYETEKKEIITALATNFQGQGFDICQLPSPSTMQTWWTYSPYYFVNLYIGGVSRACPNQPYLTRENILTLWNQGWRGFVLTWVGPQAPCSNYSNRISYESNTAYQQGRGEASNAVAIAQNLGFTTGEPIYYDLEAYNTTDTACRNAVKSFIQGWADRLRELGYIPGVYGSSCGSGMADFISMADVVWLAHWIYPTYNSSATVWNVSCVSNSLWPNYQRIRQYTGGHNETYGGITLNIDCDVAEGKLATPSTTPPPSAEITTKSVAPSTITLGQSFTVTVTGRNNGGTAGWGGISVSFPQFISTGSCPGSSYSGSEATVSGSSTTLALGFYHKGCTISSSGGSMNAQYLLVEGSKSSWGSNESHSMTLTVTPKVIGTFTIYIRMALCQAPNCSSSLPISRDPASGSPADQQGYIVYSFSVTVNPTPGYLTVTPADNFNSSGPIGGPFTPSSKNYTLQNTGGQALNWTASKTQNWVSLSQTSGTLNPGASTTVTVSINSNANNLLSGSYSDTVTFTNTTNGQGNTTRSVNLTVQAVNYPDIHLPSTTLNFGNKSIGSSTEMDLTIQNVGSATLTINSINRTSGSSEFSVVSFSSSIPAGSSGYARIRFTPAAPAGQKSATFAISSNDPDESTVTFTATGNAVTVTVSKLRLLVRSSTGNEIYMNSLTTSGVWDGWTLLSGLTTDTPAAGSFENRLYLVVKDAMDNKIWRNSWDGAIWSGWVLMDGWSPTYASLAVFNNRLYVAVRGTDNKIYLRYMDSLGTFSAWSVVPAGWTTAAPAIAAFNNRLYLVVKSSTDDKIWWNSMDAAGNWSGWQLMDGATGEAPSLAVFNNRLYVAVKGTDNLIYYRYLDGTGIWSSWRRLNGTTTHSPALAAFNNRLYLVVKSSTDTRLWMNSMDTAEVWGSWQPLDGWTSRAPALVIY